MRVLVLAGLAVLAAGAAAAQPVTGKEAKKLLFMPRESVAQILPGAGLDEQNAKVLETVAAAQPWYGAIAISPDEGLMSEATVAAAKYHDVEAAKTVALSDCNAKKKGKAECVLAAVILPKGWQQGRPLQLSAEATEAFRADYKGGAMATSATTGAFGMGADAAAALAACQAKAGAATDCTVVISG
ncbi:MAG: 5-aminolevulic acid synthase [Paracoccaceae bacterium]